MSRDMSQKGGRDGGKRRKHQNKSHNRDSGHGGGGAEGADGLAAWSKDSLADFAADQALLAQNQALEKVHVAQAVADGSAAPAAASATAGSSSSAAAASSAAPAPAAAASASSSSSSSSSPAAVPSLPFREVDGSLLEGGGQVLRNAMAYSALLGAPLCIEKIRAGRPSGGGLKAQHLKGIHLVADMTAGKLSDDHIGSRSIQFTPGSGDTSQLSNPRSAPDAQGRTTLHFEADTQTAGATGLLLQVALPVAFFLPAPVRLTLKGGTNATMAPIIDYSTSVFAPFIHKHFGLECSFDLERRGFFPKGGGVVHVTTQPVAQIRACTVTARGEVVKFSGTVLVTHGLPVHIAQRLVDTATKHLRSSDARYRNVDFDIQPRIAEESEAPLGEGVSLLLMAHTSTGCVLASSGVGARGMPAEDLARNCAEQLLANVDAGGCVDEYAQDQVILFMALAKGVSTLKTGPLTLHTRTCLYWAQYFTACRVELVQAKGDSTHHTPEASDTRETIIVRIHGVGYTTRFRK